MMVPAIRVCDLSKSFTLHVQGGVTIPVFEKLRLVVEPGECVAISGPSGAGKSTFLRSLYANYKPDSGEILVRHRGRWVDMVQAPEQEILEVRRHTIGFVSQFLRVVPRVPCVDIVSEPLRGFGVSAEQARRKAESLLDLLRIPQRLWNIAPATFSGGEQQRINIARSFAADYPVMLLDEPTASLDAKNRLTVMDLIRGAKSRGAAVVGTFHDDEERRAVADRTFEMSL
jgi:alpha-D-ribose 1-methylphosphonate 5-triphosphate synthase subunit PhnL